MFKKFIEDIVHTIKSYYVYSLVVLASTAVLVPVYFHYDRINHIQTRETQLSHLYKHMEEGTNPNPSIVLMCETIGCFGYERDGERFASAFGVDMHVTDWAMARYHEFDKIETDFNIEWYQQPFIYDIVITPPEGTPIYYKKNFYPQFIGDLKMFAFIQFGILIIVLNLFSLLSKKERALYKSISEKESGLLNNIMTVYITENLHHELLTPVKVVSTKNRMIGNIITKEDERIEKLGYGMDEKNIERAKEYVDYIEMSVEQITSVLENMRQAKMVKKSKGQSIYDIVDHAAHLIDIITTEEIEYDVDERMKGYKLKGDLPTGSLVNILLNHIKNSIEADTESILFEVEGINADKTMLINIIDNGNGIPEKVLKRLFETNNSSKSDDTSDGIRGNGLYLNKNIMMRSGGDITLVSTDGIGTTFQLKIPVKKIES